MKIIHTTTYTVKRMTVAEFRKSHHMAFMTSVNDRPSGRYLFYNDTYLAHLNQRKKIYAVLDAQEQVEQQP